MIRSTTVFSALVCALALATSGAHAQQPARVDPTLTTRDGSEPAADPTQSGSFSPRGSPCSANAGNCQELTGVTIADPRTSDIIGGAFTVADNFQPATTGNITAICFTGYYGPGSPAGTNVPTANNEAFRITIWQNNGTGLPGTQVTQIYVGANASTTLGTVTYTGTLARGTGLGTPSSLAGTTLFAWTASGLSIPVVTGTCYWMEIVGATNNVDTNSRWRWVNSTHATGAGSYADGVCLQTAVGATPTYSSIVNAFDRAFCLTIGTASNVLAVPSCGIPAAPSNALCTSALAIGPGTANPLPYAAPAGTNTYRSAANLTPYCGLSPVNGNTIWYKVTGNGTTLTASTCGPATNFDTIINVYCLPTGTTICGTSNTNLLCVANNDTGPAACVGDGGANTDASQVSWIATNGTTYLIAVYGYFAANAPIGALDFALTSDGVQAAAVTCVSDRCPVDLTTITGLTEADACGTDTNNACGNAGVMTFTLGTWLKGTIYSAAPAGTPGNGRDIDYWEYDTTTPLPDNSGGAGQTNLTVTWRIEAPMILSFYTGACTAAGPGTNITAFVGRYRPSLDGMASNGVCAPLATTITANAASTLRVLITSPDFGGIPCATGANNYAVKLDLAASGACCVVGVACQVTTSTQCTANGGTYTADNTMCTSFPCPGACCTNGVCTAVTSSAGCTGAGVYQGEGSTCALTNCPAGSGICCRGATCNTLLVQANCTTTGALAGAHFAAGPTCTGTTISGCCNADYNKVNGIEVQDIFDFINDWLAGSPFANTGGNGTNGTLAVQNIFDFINEWLAGCAP